MMKKMNQVIGRPRRDIDKNEIDILRRSGLKWTAISQLLGISRCSLQRWRDNNNYEVPSVMYVYNPKIQFN